MYSPHNIGNETFLFCHYYILKHEFYFPVIWKTGLSYFISTGHLLLRWKKIARKLHIITIYIKLGTVLTSYFASPPIPKSSLCTGLIIIESRSCQWISTSIIRNKHLIKPISMIIMTSKSNTKMQVSRARVLMLVVWIEDVGERWRTETVQHYLWHMKHLHSRGSVPPSKMASQENAPKSYPNRQCNGSNRLWFYGFRITTIHGWNAHICIHMHINKIIIYNNLDFLAPT